MELTSEFIKNKAYFGGYPTQEQVNAYEDIGFRYFVDLTQDGEKRITPYKTKYNYILGTQASFALESWTTRKELLKSIKKLDAWGDIYVQLS